METEQKRKLLINETVHKKITIKASSRGISGHISCVFMLWKDDKMLEKNLLLKLTTLCCKININYYINDSIRRVKF